MTELKPCPFCGGEPDAQYFNISPHLPGRIICACGAEMRQGRYQEEDEIISAWNTRSDYTVQAANERKFNGIPMTEENMAEHGWAKVVRCRECIHYADHEWITSPQYGLGTDIEHVCHFWHGKPTKVEPDGFCAWGERAVD